MCLFSLSDDIHVTKALVAQLLTLNNRHKEHVKVVGREGNDDSCSICSVLLQLRKLAQDVHYHLGDIDEVPLSSKLGVY